MPRMQYPDGGNVDLCQRCHAEWKGFASKSPPRENYEWNVQHPPYADGTGTPYECHDCGTPVKHGVDGNPGAGTHVKYDGHDGGGLPRLVIDIFPYHP